MQEYAMCHHFPFTTEQNKQMKISYTPAVGVGAGFAALVSTPILRMLPAALRVLSPLRSVEVLGVREALLALLLLL